jgi:hypothetical protein
MVASLLVPAAAFAQSAASAPMAPGSSVVDPTEAALSSGQLVGVPAQPAGGSSGPKQATGGGFLPSSSQGRAPGETDHFDLRRGGEGGGGAVRGGKDGPVFLNRLERPQAAAPEGRASTMVTVQKGDSLWSICDRELGNAYAWPKVWALNPTIENPHVLEPGLQIRLRAAGAEGDEGASGGRGGGLGGRAGVRAGSSSVAAKGEPYKFQGVSRTVSEDAVFQLDEGLVEDGDGTVVAEIHGAPTDRLYLAAGDEVWVRPLDGKKKKLENGQILVVQRGVAETSVGTIVHMVGSVRVTAVREGYALARAVVVEATDVIERGMSLSSAPREFRAVAPLAGGPDLEARILGSTHLHAFYGQHQVVFLDRGANDKLEPGHTLYVERQGDGLATTNYRMARTTVRLDSERGELDEARTDEDGGESLPNDRVAELRVIAVKPHSATCLVVRSRREIEKTDIARTHAAP